MSTIRTISPAEFNALAIEQESMETPQKPAPISPDKAPRSLRVIPRPSQRARGEHFVRDVSSLNNVVRRRLFTQDATDQYHELFQRDRDLADKRPEQSGAYFQRACEYSDQIFSCQKATKKARAEIRHALKGDHIEQYLHTHSQENP